MARVLSSVPATISPLGLLACSEMLPVDARLACSDAGSIVLVFTVGTFPGASTYPGPSTYPGRGSTLGASVATTNNLTETPA